MHAPHAQASLVPRPLPLHVRGEESGHETREKPICACVIGDLELKNAETMNLLTMAFNSLATRKLGPACETRLSLFECERKQL